MSNGKKKNGAVVETNISKLLEKLSAGKKLKKEETRILLTFKRNTEKLFKEKGIKGGTRARRSSQIEFKNVVEALTVVLKANRKVLSEAFEATKTDVKVRGNIGINLSLPDAPYDIQILNRDAREASNSSASSNVTTIPVKSPLAENRAAAERKKKRDKKKKIEVKGVPSRKELVEGILYENGELPSGTEVEIIDDP